MLEEEYVERKVFTQLNSDVTLAKKESILITWGTFDVLVMHVDARGAV